MGMLDGHRALITGAGRGLGLAMAEAYARAGARVLMQDVDLKVAEGEAARLKKEGLAVATIGGDVTADKDVAAIFAFLDKEWGGIDILVNNAGVSANREVLDLPLEQWDRTMAVNLRAPLVLAQEAGRRMVPQKSGNIVNISSIWGLMAAPGRIAYCVSKAAIAQMTRCLADEWAPHGIRVNAIAPGYTESKMLRDVINAGKVDEGKLHRRTPMGRFGTPQEIADMALFLVSPQSTFVTGQVIAVDGGWTAYGLYS